MLNPQAWMMPPWTRSVPAEIKEDDRLDLRSAYTLWVWEHNLEDMRSDGPYPNDRKVTDKLLNEVSEFLIDAPGQSETGDAQPPES